MSNASSALVWAHSKAQGTPLLVLLAIADHDGEGGAWPSIATLARMSRVGERAVQKSIAALVTLGELSVHLNQGGTANTRRGARPNRYTIHLACPDTCDRTARHKVTEPVDNSPLPPSHGSPLPPSHGSPLPPSHGSPLPPSHGSPEPSFEPPLETPQPPAVPTIPESVARLWTGEGISYEDQQALWATVLADPATTVPAARARQRAWFVPALARIHAEQAKGRGEALTQVRRFGEPCEHDEPGGAELHPATGLPLCPLCRVKAAS